MGPLGNAILCFAFLAIGLIASVLMFYLWGFPFDEVKFVSAAPPRLMRLHRILGWIYVAIYLYLMWEMVPRLWTYQVELPARTVAHLIMGLTIGTLLFVKILIVRFFKHLEGKMVPFLGTGLLVCTVVLTGLSTPFALRELYLSRSTAFTPANLERVGNLLPLAGLPREASLTDLASLRSLERGRTLLHEKCIECHDLRLVLARPQTPESWLLTVQRMADRSMITNPISEREQWHITAYLIAVSPDLRKTLQKQRSQELDAAASKKAGQLIALEAIPMAPERTFDLSECKLLFTKRCALCHDLEDVDRKPPKTPKDARDLVARMAENGMKGTEQDLAKIAHYLRVTYVKEGS
jgi:mono/diheme cytochrome c family protein